MSDDRALLLLRLRGSCFHQYLSNYVLPLLAISPWCETMSKKMKDRVVLQLLFTYSSPFNIPRDGTEVSNSVAIIKSAHPLLRSGTLNNISRRGQRYSSAILFSLYYLACQPLFPLRLLFFFRWRRRPVLIFSLFPPTKSPPPSVV